MNVSLKPEIREFIDEQVRSGHFASPDDVIEAGAARLMLQPDTLDDADRADIAAAEASIARGEAYDFATVAAGLRKKYLGK